MSGLDYFTLLLYVLGVFAIGAISKRRTGSQKEMFAAGGRSPWWASGLSGFMTMFSAGTFVVWGGVAYELGMVAVLINTCYGVAALLVGYFVAGRWNQLGVSTPAEYVRLRFGETGLHFFTWTMLLKRILGVSVSLYALALLLVALAPLDEGNPFRDPATGNFSVVWAIIFFGSIVVIYTVQGGLWAVLMTDVLQFIVLTAVVFMVAILMISRAGDPADVANALPEHFLQPVAARYGWFFLAGWVAIHFFMIGAEWAFVQRFIAVATPKDARKSAWLFGAMYLATPLFWLLPPLLYRAQAPNVDKEQAYILAAQSVLPSGVLGLMIAALFSATASMVSSQLNVFAGVLTNDFYRPLVNPNATEAALVRAGRAFTALLGAVLMGVAILVPRMGGAEKLIITINSLLVVPLFAPALWGLFSRKIGVREMCSVTLISFAIGLTLRFGIAGNPWIVEGDWLWPAAQFISRYEENVEVIVGVLLPIVMLAGYEWRLRGVSEGAVALEEVSSKSLKASPDDASDRQFDPFPSQIVTISLLAMGIWTSLLGLLAGEGRAIVIGVGGVLTVAGVILWLATRRLTKSGRS